MPHSWSDRIFRPVRGKGSISCYCGTCDRCQELLAIEQEEERKFARLMDPDYYHRRSEPGWRSSLSGGEARVLVGGNKMKRPK